MSLHLQCRTTLLYVQYSTFVSKIYELAIKVNFLSTTQMSTCLPLGWRVYRMQEKSLLSFKNNNKKQEIIILFFIMCIHGEAVYTSTHGIRKRSSDLLELQGGMKHPVWALGTELTSSATTLRVLNIWAIFLATTVFKSYMLNGRTGGIIKELNSSFLLQCVIKGTKKFLCWHPFSLRTGIRGGSIWKTAKWWGDMGGK